MEQENVRVDSPELNRLREWCKELGLKIGSFVTKLIKSHMDKIDKRKQSLKK